MSRARPLGADLRRSIGSWSTPVWFRPIEVEPLPAPWARLVGDWLDAFGLDVRREGLRVMSVRGGGAVALPDRGHFMLVEGAPGLAAELDLMAAHLDAVATARRRDAMIRSVRPSGAPPAWAFLAPALAGAVLQDRGMSADDLVAGIFRWGRGWNRGTGRTRATRFLERLGLRACVEGERLKLDARLGEGVWFRDVGRGRLELDRRLPESVMAALTGSRRIGDVVEHTGLACATAPIAKAQGREGVTLLDFDMPSSLLAEPPASCLGWPGAAVTPAGAGGVAVPWRSDGVLRRRLPEEAKVMLAAR